MNGCGYNRERRRESLRLVCSESQCTASQVGLWHFASAGILIHYRTAKQQAIYFYYFSFDWLSVIWAGKILGSNVEECCTVLCILYTPPSVQLIPFDWLKKLGHILSHVWRSACSASGLIFCRTLCVAHSNTQGDPPLYWLPQTSMRSAVLATAVEEDEGGRGG